MQMAINGGGEGTVVVATPTICVGAGSKSTEPADRNVCPTWEGEKSRTRLRRGTATARQARRCEGGVAKSAWRRFGAASPAGPGFHIVPLNSTLLRGFDKKIFLGCPPLLPPSLGSFGATSPPSRKNAMARQASTNGCRNRSAGRKGERSLMVIKAN